MQQGKQNLLEGFEDPSLLAATFVSEHALSSAIAVGTPWAHARAIAGSTRDSLLLLSALVSLVLVQIVAFFVVLTAGLKLFAPGDYGLWVGPDAGDRFRGGADACRILQLASRIPLNFSIILTAASVENGKRPCITR